MSSSQPVGVRPGGAPLAASEAAPVGDCFMFSTIASYAHPRRVAS
jgi:hypothetical protein